MVCLLPAPCCCAACSLEWGFSRLLCRCGAFVVLCVFARPVSGGFAIVVQGSNFFPGLTAVTLTGGSCSNNAVTPCDTVTVETPLLSSLTCVAPAGCGVQVRVPLPSERGPIDGCVLVSLSLCVSCVVILCAMLLFCVLRCYLCSVLLFCVRVVDLHCRPSS